MKKLGKGMPLDIKFYSGETKDGLHRTVAKCAVRFDNIPDSLRNSNYFPNWVRDGLNRNSIMTTITAETICKPDDEYDKYTGELIVRKKIIRSFLNYIESIVLDRAHRIEDERNDICDYIDFLESTTDSITDYLKKF